MINDDLKTFKVDLKGVVYVHATSAKEANEMIIQRIKSVDFRNCEFMVEEFKWKKSKKDSGE